MLTNVYIYSNIYIKGADKVNLKNMLIEYRAKNSLTQQEVANKIGVSRDIILRCEKGTYPRRPVTLKKLEIFLIKEYRIDKSELERLKGEQ